MLKFGRNYRMEIEDTEGNIAGAIQYDSTAE